MGIFILEMSIYNNNTKTIGYIYILSIFNTGNKNIILTKNMSCLSEVLNTSFIKCHVRAADMHEHS